MRTRALGRTGIQVSPYCLGTMMFGKLGNPDHEDCARIIHRALDAGVNFIDTADVYGYSETEEIIGKALRGRRDNVVLATKFNGVMGQDPNRRGSSRRWIMTAVEDSLRRLRVDHIDLYQIHHPEPGTDLEETLSALTDLLRSGKVRAIGSSNLPASEIVEGQWLAERRGLARLRTEQPTYSILNRAIEREVLPVCRRYGIGTLVWSPLASGMLAGRYRKGRPSDSQRLKWVPKYLTDERALDLVEQLIALAREAGMPITHMAMAFAVNHPDVTSAIIGPRTLAHLEDLLAGAGVVLEDALLDRIDALAPPGTDIATMDIAYRPPALQDPALRRRPAAERAAAPAG
ncbi:aldo/keto reductase [Streptomyces sp. TRM 70361]|uniref:aldo/keto reductase n=1 Tax=Streptomyces sp. TRM 70361 TaxID=3116553 RepID=UPI002E7B20F7|nr:aldo/keto reductase [Streptomyces sp. TRM 70361]MEE1940009.1 aldo/keto reductase [Streptomyces sp. TRM 70361]